MAYSFQKCEYPLYIFYRPTDPRQKPESTEPPHVPPVPHREPTQINSREGDCPYRMIRVLYVKQRIPTNISLSDSKYKNDPRVQKMLRQQELESGIVIDHSGISVKPSDPRAKAETTKGLPEPKFPLLDNVKKEPSLPRPELAPFVDPRPKVESRPELPPFVDPRINSDPRIKPEISDTRPQDPRTRPMDVNNIVTKPSDPRLQRMSSNQGIATHNMPGMGLHNLPVRPMDPRLARQDSNSSASGRPMDPRLSRQTSRDMSGSNLGSSPSDPRLSKTSSVSEGMNDPRLLGRQTSDPRLLSMDSSSESFSTNKPFDPRLGRMLDTDSGPPSVLRQMSQPNTVAEKASADTKSDSKPKLDYRNDPRFKRKPISESNLSPSSIVKRSSQTDRKSSTDYISPLGGDNSRTEENTGYNSYNRPRPPKPVPQNASAPKIQITPDMVPKASEDISTHDILDSLKILSPPVMEHSSSSSDKHLKDIFKTIDPTASPFC